MSNKGPVDRMKDLVSSLPERDIKFAEKFINTRDFESLQLLVDSALVRVKNGLNKENPKEEYLKADLEGITKLKSEVDIYCDALGIDKQSSEYDDFNDEEYNQDYY